MTYESPIVQEVRARAMKIGERFDHNLQKYCEYLRDQEKKHPERIVNQIAVIQSKDVNMSGS
jgi:hypothetical protein